MIVVSDTSPISSLIKIEQLQLLPAIYHQIIIPTEVYSELLHLEKKGIDLSEFKQAHWLRIVEPTDQREIASLRRQLDKGESTAIVLAEEIHADYLLIDELKGRGVAQSRGLKTIGLLGVLLEAKEKKLIPALKPLINDLVNIARFRLSEKLIEDVLLIANEN